MRSEEGGSLGGWDHQVYLPRKTSTLIPRSAAVRSTSLSSWSGEMGPHLGPSTNIYLAKLHFEPQTTTAVGPLVNRHRVVWEVESPPSLRPSL